MLLPDYNKPSLLYHTIQDYHSRKGCYCKTKKLKPYFARIRVLFIGKTVRNKFLFGLYLFDIFALDVITWWTGSSWAGNASGGILLIECI